MRIIGLGFLGIMTAGTFTVATERAAHACQHLPPADECATLQLADDTTLFAQATETSETPAGANCGCGAAATLPVPGSTIASAQFVDERGNPTEAFCAEGDDENTSGAFASAFPGQSWGAGLAALSTSGIVPGQKGYVIFEIDNNPSGALPERIALAQINFDGVGGQTVDDSHQVVKDIDAKQCTQCTDASNTQGCTALVNAAARLGGGLGGGGISQAQGFEIKPAPVCAQTDATFILGLEPYPEENDGGCNASGGGGAGALLFGMFAVGMTVVGRRRRS